MNLNYCIRKNEWPEKVAASVNWPWKSPANSPSEHYQHFLPWEKQKDYKKEKTDLSRITKVTKRFQILPW